MFLDTAKNHVDDEYVNAYPLMHAKGIYEGQRCTSDTKRVVNLTRASYIGQQKYGTIMWSGDISAKWDTLKKQIPAGLNFCATDLPYWTLDIGHSLLKKVNNGFGMEIMIRAPMTLGIESYMYDGFSLVLFYLYFVPTRQIQEEKFGNLVKRGKYSMTPWLNLIN